MYAALGIFAMTDPACPFSKDQEFSPKRFGIEAVISRKSAHRVREGAYRTGSAARTLQPGTNSQLSARKTARHRVRNSYRKWQCRQEHPCGAGSSLEPWSSERSTQEQYRPSLANNLRVK